MRTMGLEEFEEYIRSLIRNGDIEKAVKEIQNAQLSEEDLTQLFMWLHTDGYDSKTGRWKLEESSNVAFLNLVKQVQAKVGEKK